MKNYQDVSYVIEDVLIQEKINVCYVDHMKHRIKIKLTN